MQRLFLILFLLLTGFVAFCQTRSATPGFSARSNQTFVVEDGNLSARNGLFVPRFADSTEALTYTLKDTLGNVVYLYSTKSLWVRTISSGTTKKWLEVGSGGGGSGITVGSTTITSGTNTRVLFNNSGVVGEYTISGTGNVAMTTSSLFTTPRLNSTSTIGYVWTATDGSGNGSFQVIPDFNLPVDSIGVTGVDLVVPRNDSLLHRLLKAGIFTLTDTVVSSGEARVNLDTANASLKSYIAANSGAVSGANTALSNLASVAINTSLISDADNTDDLGSAAFGWKDVYLRTGKFDGSTSGTTTLQASAVAGTTTATLPATTTTLAGLAVAETFSAAQTFSATTTFNGTTVTGNNLVVRGGNTAVISTDPLLLFLGTTGVAYRAHMIGTTSPTIANNESYAGLVIGQSSFTESSGVGNNHDFVGSLVIKPPLITGAVATISNTSTVYIENSPSATVSGRQHSIWVDNGLSRFDGGILGTTTNDDATAGNIGERQRAIQSTYTNYTTTATYQNITSISLTAGDWDLSAFFTYSTNSATITAGSDAIFVISTTTASAAGAVEGESIAYVPQAALLGTSHFSDGITPYRVSLNATTTYYLNTQATFTLGNPQFVGSIRAVRIR